MVPPLDAARRVARSWVRARIVHALEERRAALDDARGELLALRQSVGAAEVRAAAVAARFDPAPFRLDMTVHAAHARGAAVAAAFARRGLPNCPACAVGADETLAEAAFAEGFPIAALIDELNALAPVFETP